MHFSYEGTDEGLKAAAEYCEKLHSRDEFWEAIISNGPYNYSDASAEDIATYMRGYNGVVSLKFFTGRLRYRNTVAYVSSGDRHHIYYNTRYLRNAISRKVNTLVHEFVHITDYFGDSSNQIEYGHGDQSSEGKGKSAPYAIGKIAEDFYKSDNPSFIKNVAIEPLHFQCDLGELPEEMIVDDV